MRWFRNRTTGVVEAWPDTDPGKLAEMVTREGPVHSLPHEEVTSEIGGGGGGGSLPEPPLWTIDTETGTFVIDLRGTPAGATESGIPWRVITDWLDMGLDSDQTILRMMGLGGAASQIRLMEDDLPGSWVEVNSFYGVDMNSAYAQILHHSGGQRFFLMSTQVGFLTSVNAVDPANVFAGEMAVSFDKTDGAAKLLVKAKTADGTVVSGELALAP